MLFVSTFYISALTFFVWPVALRASQRLCELQGTCFRCDPGHFSHFVCHSDSDCFPGQFCVPMRGFCCPSRPFSAASATEKCPDGSGWERMCKEDKHCLFRDELCAEGKCCPSCRQRRLQSLREANSLGAASSERSLLGVVIPQCSDDGKLYRPMQCAGGSNECYCVDKFGRKIGPKMGEWWGNTTKQHRDREVLLLNCSQVRKALEEKKKDGDEAFMAMANRDEGQQWQTDANSNEGICTDSLRVFRRCGSACPISCAARIAPRCPQEQCLRGCFCRLPYVILDASDPFASRCVLPSECPLLTFTSDLDSWSGDFFPAAIASVRQTEGKCADPLKNFQSCGSACRVGCGHSQADERREWTECSAKCVSGCFCRAPFLLQDPSDADSACVLSRQCAPQPPEAPPAPSQSAAPPPFQSAAVAPQPPGVPPPPFQSPAVPGNRICLSSENKTWTSCLSRKCSSSCADLSASSTCVADDCLPGCQCNAPAVVRDKSASVWQCILPENCSQKDLRQKKRLTPMDCEDSRKEFLICGSSCPLGCDRLGRPMRTCSPCVSGCFCRNGFVFANASDWRRSECVSVSECPFDASPPVTATNIFQKLTDNAIKGSHFIAQTLAESTDAEKDCGEALARATLLRKDGQRLGRVVAMPEQRTDGKKSQRIHLNAEFVVDAATFWRGAERELLLSIYPFSGTTKESCVGLGPPLALRVLEEESAERLQQEGFDTVSSANMELKALPREDSKGHGFGMDLNLAWPDPIALGTNPLVGHSVELKLRKRGEAEPFLLGCAIFDVTMSCRQK